MHHFTLAPSPKTIHRRLLWRLTAPWCDMVGVAPGAALHKCVALASVRDPRGHREPVAARLSDVYLRGLAAHHGGRLVTFDRTIEIAAVRTASPDNLVVL